MDPSFDDIPADRLIEAADAIYRARAEFGGGRLPGLPTELLGKPNQPEAFVDFTHAELWEATLFLARMGLLRYQAQPGG